MGRPSLVSKKVCNHMPFSMQVGLSLGVGLVILDELNHEYLAPNPELRPIA
jgi:hypothetical protein